MALYQVMPPCIILHQVLLQLAITTNTKKASKTMKLRFEDGICASLIWMLVVGKLNQGQRESIENTEPYHLLA